MPEEDRWQSKHRPYAGQHAHVKNRCAFPLSCAWSNTACASCVVSLLEDDERKGRTEGPFVLSSEAGDGKVKAQKFK